MDIGVVDLVIMRLHTNLLINVVGLSIGAFPTLPIDNERILLRTDLVVSFLNHSSEILKGASGIAILSHPRLLGQNIADIVDRLNTFSQSRVNLVSFLAGLAFLSLHVENRRLSLTLDTLSPVVERSLDRTVRNAVVVLGSFNVLFDQVVDILLSQNPVLSIDVALVGSGRQNSLRGAVAIKHFLDLFKIENLVLSIVLHLDVLRVLFPSLQRIKLFLQDIDLLKGVLGSSGQLVPFFLAERLAIAC